MLVASRWIAPLLTLMLTGCGAEGDLGPERTERRNVSAFDRIEMRGDARLNVTIGAAPALELEGVDGLLRETTTHVQDGTLVIDNRQHSRKWLKRVRPVEIRISMPHLTALKVHGGNDVRLHGFAGGESTFDIEGAAHVDASGQLDQLTVRMQGAGLADFEKLVATRAAVTVDGVGSAYVHATDSLRATMNGVGSILYSGDPREVQTSMNGLGKVGPRDGDAQSPRERKPPGPDPDTLNPEYEREQIESEDPIEV